MVSHSSHTIDILWRPDVPRHLLRGHSRVEKTGPLSVLKGQCAAKLGPAPLATMLTDRPTKAEKPSPPLLIMTGCLVPLTFSHGA